VTPPSVRRAERVARIAIAAGGWGTILTVVVIFGFLLWVVLPLFQGAEVSEARSVPHAASGEERVAPAAIAVGCDDQLLQAWSLLADGTLEVRALRDGALIDRQRPFGTALPTAFASFPDAPEAVFGFADGTVRKARIDFVTRYPKPTEVPEDARDLRPGAHLRWEGGVLQVTPSGAFRHDRIFFALDEPFEGSDRPIRLVDLSIAPNGAPVFAWMDDGGRVRMARVTSRYDIMQDRDIAEFEHLPIAIQAPALDPPPAWLLLSGIATNLSLVWRDGRLLRYDVRADADPQHTDTPAEEVDLLPGEGEISHARWLLGKGTMLIGYPDGGVGAWFPTRPDPDAGAGGPIARDNLRLVHAHHLPGPGQPLTAMDGSRRNRLVALGYADGTLRCFNVTNERLLAEFESPVRRAIPNVAFAPKEDGIVVLRPDALEHWTMDPGHPAGGFSAMFGKVWYEGASAPAHEWQAVGGTDDFEPKLGLVKLIFGTLKATLYSILFGGPIALLAALFTSEFLEPRWRAKVKSIVEVMAGLPSVVLGFLAAMVISPYVQGVLPTVLVAFYTVPLLFVLGARAWQMLPDRLALRWAGKPRLLAITACLPLAVLLAVALGPGVEGACFGGNIEQWLRGDLDAVVGGWAFLLFPVSLLAVAVAISMFVGPWLRRASAGWSRLACACADLGRYAAIVGGAALLSWALGWVLAGWGSDPRGGVVGEYTQRNSLIVGFVMGFAIIPIIYTLAEDALSSVPVALREGSLGCGATPWQTALRIVVPTAGSGLFGALMVGLGRAVGETMIVLMAAGNTPIMDWNVFQGFRTLSANIATELPEAVKDSTHFRVLFLAGLVLFCMTFVINTLAEMVRRRSRRRFADL